MTLLAATDRFLYLLPCVNTYFNQLPNVEKKSKHFNNISRYLKADGPQDAELMLLMTKESATLFDSFLLLFQSERPLIHKLYDTLNNLVLLIAAKICVQVELNLRCQEIFGSDNLLKLNGIKLSNTIQDRIRKLEMDEETENEFRHLYRNHYCEVGQYLVDKVNWRAIKGLKLLSPSYLFGENLQSAEFLDELLVYFAEEDFDHTKVRDEYVLAKMAIKSTNQDDLKAGDKNIDRFWNNFFQTNSEKYPNLDVFFKSLLSISHGQSDTERGFSTSGLILTEDRSCMSEKTLNARLNTIDAIRCFGKDVTQIPIDRALITLAINARKAYGLYLEEEKQKRLEKKRQEALKEKEREEMEAIRAKRGKHRLELDELNEEISNLVKKVGDKQKTVKDITDAAERMLSKGLATNNVEQMKAAKEMLEQARKQRSEIEEDEKML